MTTLEAMCALYSVPLHARRERGLSAVGDPPSHSAVTRNKRGDFCVVREWYPREKFCGIAPDVAALHELMHVVFWHPIYEFRVTEMLMFGAEAMAAAMLGVQKNALFWQDESVVRMGEETYFADMDLRKRSMLMKYSFLSSQELGVLDAEFRLTYKRAHWASAGKYTLALLCRDYEIDYGES